VDARATGPIVAVMVLVIVLAVTAGGRWVSRRMLPGSSRPGWVPV